MAKTEARTVGELIDLLNNAIHHEKGINLDSRIGVLCPENPSVAHGHVSIEIGENTGTDGMYRGLFVAIHFKNIKETCKCPLFEPAPETATKV
jgi:hypothetical protein